MLLILTFLLAFACVHAETDHVQREPNALARKMAETRSVTPGLCIKKNSSYIQCSGNAVPENDCGAVGGTLDGARCFFVAKDKSNWENSWKVCQQQNGRLAQIHTTSEFTKFKAMIEKRDPKGSDQFYIALQRAQGVRGDPCSVTPDRTYWYDTPGEPNRNLPVHSTWLINHMCGDYDTGDEYCMTINTGHQNYTFNDVACGRIYNVSCQFLSATGEHYTKTDICMNETAIEFIKGTNPEDCANACWKETWCRSFNFLPATAQNEKSWCELYSWSVMDGSPNGPIVYVPSTPNECVHYNYVPNVPDGTKTK